MNTWLMLFDKKIRGGIKVRKIGKILLLFVEINMNSAHNTEANKIGKHQ